MKQIKKLVTIGLISAMVLGTTLTANAAPRWGNFVCATCGYANKPQSGYRMPYACRVEGCNAAVIHYNCDGCAHGWDECTSAHRQW